MPHSNVVQVVLGFTKFVLHVIKNLSK